MPCPRRRTEQALTDPFAGSPFGQRLRYRARDRQGWSNSRLTIGFKGVDLTLVWPLARVCEHVRGTTTPNKCLLNCFNDFARPTDCVAMIHFELRKIRESTVTREIGMEYSKPIYKM